MSVLLVMVSGSATVLDSFGVISGEASVDRALEIEEIYYNSAVDNDSSGEYVVLESRLDEVDLSEWKLTDGDAEVDELESLSETVSKDKILLIDNSESDKVGHIENLEDTEDYAVYNVDTILNGLVDGGQVVDLRYLGDSETSVHEIEYEGDCSDEESYFTDEQECKSSTFTIEGDYSE